MFFYRTVKVTSVQWLCAVTGYVLAGDLTERFVELELVDVSCKILEREKGVSAKVVSKQN